MKKKISLSDLRVKSFVTAADGADAQTVKGGYKTHYEECLYTGRTFCLHPSKLYYCEQTELCTAVLDECF